MKEGKKVTIKINFTNRWLYTFILIGILVIISAGVYAWANSAGVGHEYTEIKPCANGQILKTNLAGTAWECAGDTDTDTRCDTTNCGQLRTSSSTLVTNLNADMVDGKSISTAIYQCPSVPAGDYRCTSTCGGQITTSSTCTSLTWMSYPGGCYGSPRDCTLLGYLIR
jgi:hypothetical protein